MTFGAVKSGSEFLVNTVTTDDQNDVRVTALPDGEYLVVWESVEVANGIYTGIYGQRYDASGATIGVEFQIHTIANFWQARPSVTLLVDGSVVVSWNSWGQDGHLRGVYAQMYDDTGIAIGSEFLVNTHTDNYQTDQEITALSGGGFVIIWESNNQEGDGFVSYGVYGQQYDETGTPVGGEFQVNTETAGNQYNPATAALDDGGFIVTWESYAQDGGYTGIYAQRYDAAGVASGGEFLVNGVYNVQRYAPSVASLEDGGFVIAWESEGQDGDGRGIYAQMYDSTSTKVGTEFVVNTHATDDQSEVRVASLPDGGFVMIWTSEAQDGDFGGIYGQRFDSEGATVGGEFVVNTTTTGTQELADIAVSADSSFIVTWQSDGTDGSGLGIYAQQFEAVLIGSANDETLLDDHDTNLIYGQGGADTIKGKGGRDTIYGGTGGDTLLGGAKNDTIFGGGGRDFLEGGTGDDVLKGNKNLDVLTGGLGEDTLTGGGGSDRFVFNDAAESATNFAADVITDFVSGLDLIHLSNMVSGLTFIGSASFSGALEVRAVVSGSDVLVRVDVDGDGSADTKIVLEGVASVTSADFIL